MADERIDNMKEVRTSLFRLADTLLVGPLRADETIDSAPVDTYLTGILWPRGSAIDGIDDERDLGMGIDPDSGFESSIPGYRAIRPCSIGITFAVKSGSSITVSLGETSRYDPVEVESPDSQKKPEGTPGSAPQKNEEGNFESGEKPVSANAKGSKKMVWVRRRLGYTIRLEPEPSSSTIKINRFIDSQGSEIEDTRISLHIRRRVGHDQDVFTVTLINEETETDEPGGRNSRCLFQTGIVIHASFGSTGLIQPRPQAPIKSDDEDALSNALLFRDRREFAVGHGIATVWDEESDVSVGEVRTSWLPSTHVKGVSPEGNASLSDFLKKHPDAFKASSLGKEAVRQEVVEAMTAFAKCYVDWIETTLRSRLGQFESELHRAALMNLERCVTTAKRIHAGVEVLRKDDNAWTAFAMANSAMDRQSRYPSKGESSRALVWRPFQLAYMLLVIPGLADPLHADRQCMDLLWFPTGGGKTEAYLALTAFQIFHRRLVDESRRTLGGVDVLMRYTLRLLTVQQFQRAASLITACDALREADKRLGDARITLGLYVGGDTTPNRMDDARLAIEAEHADQKPKSTPRQLLRCPVCGSELGESAYQAEPDEPRINIVCSKSGCETGGRPLPVLTVDDTIYANPPSLLIGTIDKFAQIPRRTDMRRIFGLDGGLPPGLVIQDELHLISGPLGSMAGLYETVIDLLCTRNKIRPKVIGSTATIGHAATQVRSLFDRSVLQFPPPGFDAEDSFFAVRDTQGPDRLYIGIPTAGRSPKFALQALLAALLQSAAAIRLRDNVNDQAIDPYWTCVAYFNSLRELGGAYVLMQDDVPRQMQFLAGRLEMARRELQLLPVELSSRQSSRELPELLQALSSTLTQFTDNPFENAEPKDSVLASNMISVGVDVPRLGLMVVNGQPKSTAEYIQASSRVGRNIPGLVFTLYNFGRPRDLSHFEHFRTYHSALYRSVEATSVTPWAPRARDKALHAVVASVVRHLVPGMLDDENARLFDPKSVMVKSLVDAIIARVAAASPGGLEAHDTKLDLDAILSEWGRRSHEAQTTSTRLLYWEKKAPFGKTSPHLMCSAEAGVVAGRLSWPTPNSMREVEPSTAFIYKQIQRRSGGQDGNS